MSRESNQGHVCPKCETTIYREECACPPPRECLIDGSDCGSTFCPVKQKLEFEDLQTYLGRMWALYHAPSTAFLIQQRSFPSPLVGVKRMKESWDEL